MSIVQAGGTRDEGRGSGAVRCRAVQCPRRRRYVPGAASRHRNGTVSGTPTTSNFASAKGQSQKKNMLDGASVGFGAPHWAVVPWDGELASDTSLLRPGSTHYWVPIDI